MNYFLPLAYILLVFHVVLGSEEVNNEEFTKGETGEDSLHRVRRGLSMLRLGRGLQMLRLGKRALPMLRLGRSTGDGLSSDEVRYLLSLVRTKDQVPLPRYGKDLEFQYMLMNALINAQQQQENELYDDSEGRLPPGFGYDLGSMPERQIRPIPRPGRFRRSADLPAISTDSEISNDESDLMYDGLYNDKRVAALPRYGKEVEGESETEKRAMRMLRLGRGMRMLRLGKRPDKVDGEVDDDVEAEKRALRLLRLGKRPYNMLRLGRGYNDDEKRALRLLRLGKRLDDGESS